VGRNHLYDSIYVLTIATHNEEPKPSRKDITEAYAQTKGLCSKPGKDGYSTDRRLD
jgi:hypothetical protein